MPLEGLRAWIAEVEHKLGMRTRVFLALATIALGAAGAGIYLAIDARDSSVSEMDVQTLQSELESQIESTDSAGGESARLEGEVKALQAQVQALQSEGESSAGEEDESTTGPDKSPEASGKAGAEEAPQSLPPQTAKKSG